MTEEEVPLKSQAARAITRSAKRLAIGQRDVIRDADPITWLIAYMQGEEIKGPMISGVQPKGEVASLEERKDVAKFLANKIVANLKPGVLEDSESSAADWTKRLSDQGRGQPKVSDDDGSWTDRLPNSR